MSSDDQVDLEIEELEGGDFAEHEERAEEETVVPAAGTSQSRRRKRRTLYEWRTMHERVDDELLQRTTVGCFMSYNAGDRFRYYRCMLHARCEKRFRLNALTRRFEESGEHGEREADLGPAGGGAWRVVAEALGEEECRAVTADHQPLRLPGYLRDCVEVLQCVAHDRCAHLLKVTVDPASGTRVVCERGDHSTAATTIAQPPRLPRRRRASRRSSELASAQAIPQRVAAPPPDPRPADGWALLRRGLTGVACEAATAEFVWQVFGFIGLGSPSQSRSLCRRATRCSR